MRKYGRGRLVPAQRSIALLGVIGILAFNAPKECPAQQIARQIDNQASIYCWTEDLPSLLDRSLRAFGVDWIDVEEWTLTRVDDLLSAGDSSIDRQSLEQDLRFIIDGLRGEVFGSSVLLATYQVDGEITDSMLIAHTEESEREVGEFLAAVVRVVRAARVSVDADSTAKDRSEVSAEMLANEGINVLEDELGYWSIQDCWFLWSPSLPRLREQIEFHGGERASIGDDRAFRYFVRRVRTARAGSVSLYAAPSVLPHLASRFGYDFFGHLIWLGNWDSIWRVAHLNELRGVGAQVIFDEDGGNGLDSAVVTLDAMAVLTAPRQGILSALRSQDGLSYDAPVPSGRLDRFIQFEIDGRKFVEEMNGMRKRILKELPDDVISRVNDKQMISWHDGYGMDSGQFDAILSGVRELCLFDTGWWGPRQPHSYGNIGLRFGFEDSESLDLIESLVEAELTSSGMVSESDLVERIREGSTQRWRVTEQALESTRIAVRDRRQQFLEGRLQSLKNTMLRNEKREPTDEEIAELEEQTNGLWDRLSRDWFDRWSSEEWLLRDDWYLLFAASSEKVTESLGQSSPHPQLVELKQRVQSLRRAHRLPRPFGVMAYWPEVGDSGDDGHRGETSINQFISPSESNDSAVAAAVQEEIQLAWIDALDRALRSLDCGLMIFTEDDRGFRVTGSVIRAKFEQE